MTIAQYLPHWLRRGARKRGPKRATTASKKDRQVLPTLTKPQHPPARFQDDDSPPGYRIQWRQ